VNAIASELLVVADAIVAVTTATTPLLMVLASIPDATQDNEPVLEAQVRVALTAVSAGPAATPKDVMSPGGYVSVHCRLAGEPPLPAASERFKEIEVPLVTDPEARVSDDPCE